uniref:Uncharacterized protein n=1 Tax=Cacopsylla melanoneura TaxID=428564 RepID=A0A8D8U942_9HEMI
MMKRFFVPRTPRQASRCHDFLHKELSTRLLPVLSVSKHDSETSLQPHSSRSLQLHTPNLCLHAAESHNFTRSQRTPRSNITQRLPLERNLVHVFPLFEQTQSCAQRQDNCTLV